MSFVHIDFGQVGEETKGWRKTSVEVDAIEGDADGIGSRWIAGHINVIGGITDLVGVRRHSCYVRAHIVSCPILCRPCDRVTKRLKYFRCFTSECSPDISHVSDQVGG